MNRLPPDSVPRTIADEAGAAIPAAATAAATNMPIIFIAKSLADYDTHYGRPFRIEPCKSRANRWAGEISMAYIVAICPSVKPSDTFYTWAKATARAADTAVSR
ncbi:hypothetical protein GCM10011529_24000 [Polymorphobacter glacialis]|uniref:Uncharacterized protein n=1 Tax=Sandarakinorhabdus glacialis TaxID=1614636 RepID=A0A916ZWH2_9SPHN|nr:hypothetical protein GCM10011529_24000 [Polymorphobacter glacialis]